MGPNRKIVNTVVTFRQSQNLKKNANPHLAGDFLTEPEFPYNKEPNGQGKTAPPPPTPPPEPPYPPSPPPLSTPTPNRFNCQVCGKTFSTREELTMHMETVHQSPKKEV